MLKAIITTAYEPAIGGEEDIATVDYCIVPATAENRRTLTRLFAVLERAKELGIPNPAISGEIEAAWIEESEWSEAGLSDLPEDLEAFGHAVIEIPPDAFWLEMSTAKVETDRTFFVTRIDDFKPRSQYIKLEVEKNAEATPVQN